MKKLIFLKNSISIFNGKEYVISQFIDIFNYKILFGTDLNNANKLVSGNEYDCQLDVSYNPQKKEYKFKVILVK